MSPQADAYRYQTVAVTGATGLVGQYLVRRLLYPWSQGGWYWCGIQRACLQIWLCSVV